MPIEGNWCGGFFFGQDSTHPWSTEMGYLNLFTSQAQRDCRDWYKCPMCWVFVSHLLSHLESMVENTPPGDGIKDA